MPTNTSNNIIFYNILFSMSKVMSDDWYQIELILRPCLLAKVLLKKVCHLGRRHSLTFSSRTLNGLTNVTIIIYFILYKKHIGECDWLEKCVASPTFAFTPTIVLVRCPMAPSPLQNGVWHWVKIMWQLVNVHYTWSVLWVKHMSKISCWSDRYVILILWSSHYILVVFYFLGL